MSWDKNLPLEPVFALDTLRNRVNTILKSNQNRNNTQEGDYPNLDTQHCENQYFITSQLPLNWNPQEIIERILLHWDTETGTFGTKDNIFFEDRVRYKSIDGTKAHVALLNFTCNAFWAPAFDSYWQNQPMSSRIQFFKDHPEYNPLQINNRND